MVRNPNKTCRIHRKFVTFAPFVPQFRPERAQTWRLNIDLKSMGKGIGSMRNLWCSAKRHIAVFTGRESGTATVEAVLWFPIFIVIFSLMVDAAMIFNGQARVLRVVQDANRNMSIGRLTTTTETEDYVENALAVITSGAVAQSTVTAGVVSTTVTVPAADFQILGFFSALNNLQIGVTAEHLIEDWET